RHADDNEVVRMLFLQGDQLGHLTHASGAPGGPKVDQHHFAAKVREPDFVALECAKLEIARGHRPASGPRRGWNREGDGRKPALMLRPPPLGPLRSCPGFFAAAV